MTDALVKLKDPVPDFKYFAEDQILTADDLNRVVDFLDRQHRMTRSYALGVGIVCGLEPRRLPFSRISVTRGAAISTDGDLLVLDDDTVYTHFAEFKDPDAKYQTFRKTNGQIIPMWDLSTEAGPGRTSLSQFENTTNIDFDELVVVLYLESYLEAEEECDGPDCDKRGDRQMRNLKCLLVKASDISATVQQDAKAALSLPRLDSIRVDLGGNRITSYSGRSGLANRYARAITETKRRVVQAFQQLMASPFRPMVESVVDGNANWAGLLNQARFRAQNNTLRVQYVYAFYQDLVDAWNEWRDYACQLPRDCLPDPNQFAKHIVLGEVDVNVATTERTRHYFRPSALLKQGDEVTARCHFLLRRIDVLLRAFQASAISEIRLTPSKSKCHPLAARAIPYYFFDRANAPRPRSAWSYESTQTEAVGHILSYHASDDAEASEEAKKPFSFGSLSYDFLRIEGHLDRRIDDVEADLERLRKQHNVPFQILAVQVDDVVEKVKIPGKFRFPDLDAIFRLKKIDILNSVHAANDFGQFARAEIDKVGQHEQKDEAKTHIGNFTVEMKKTIRFLPRNLTDFNEENATKFKSSLEKSFQSAEHFERVSTDIFRPTKASPIQDFLHGKRFRDYGLLLDLYEKRKRKVQEKSIFANFCAENPGIEHLGGVPVGGTFVLIYEADSRKVLADFCLPYFSYFDMTTLEPEELEEPEEPAPQPIPLPRPPLVVKPPFVFTPEPWININKFRIDTLRGDEIRKQIEKTRVDLKGDFETTVGNAKVEFGNLITDRVNTERLNLENGINQKFTQKEVELKSAFDDRVNETKTIFQAEIESKINTVEWKFDRSRKKLDVHDLLEGGSVAVDPDTFKIVEDINVTRETQNRLQTKKALGGALSLEEEAALKQADTRLTNLIVKATKRPSLTVASPDAASKAVIDQLRQVSLGIEGTANRRKLANRFGALPPNSFGGRQLGGIRNILTSN